MEMNQEIIKTVREYYKHSNLWLPEHPKFRMFKIQFFNGKTINLKKKIKDKEQLKQLLIKYCPKHIWFSVGCWIDSQQVKGYETEKWNAQIKRDLIFDIDDKSLNKARLKTKEVLKKLPKYLGKPNYILFSGSKGFHIYFQQSKETKRYIESKSYNKLKHLIDLEITRDKFRVVRLPNSLHGKTGYISTIIQAKDLNKSVPKLLDKIKRHYVPQDFVEDSKSPKSNDEYRQMQFHMNRGSAEMESFAPSKTYYLTNKIIGTKNRGILYLHFNQDLREVILRVKVLQKKYNLGTLYFLQYKNQITVMGLKSQEMKRLKKIYSESTSLNKSFFLRRNFVKIRFLNVYEGKILKCKVKTLSPLFYLEQRLKGNHKVSSSHSKLLKDLGEDYFEKREKEGTIKLPYCERR